MVRGWDTSFIQDVCDPCEFFETDKDAIKWAEDYMDECTDNFLELQVYVKTLTLGCWQMIGFVERGSEFEPAFC